MLKWSNKSRTPRDGWRYYQAETNTMITAPHWNGLLQLVSEHRSANNLPIEPGWDREIEEYMCNEIPDGCHEVAEIKAGPVTMSQVLTFTQILGESILRGNQRVEQDEADRRALICANCPANVEPEGCVPCGLQGVAKLLTRFVGGGKTLHDNRLNSCKHCGCLNKAQVWFPLSLLQKHTSKRVMNELPHNCWKKHE